jgi:Flp pilus assembly protein TadB
MEEKISLTMDKMLSYPTEIYIIAILLLLGLILAIAGFSISSYRSNVLYAQIKSRKKISTEKVIRVMEVITELPIIRSVKKRIKESLEINMLEEYQLNLRANIFSLAVILISAFTLTILWGVGQLWYVKILLLIMSGFFPFYILTLALDVIRNNIQKQIPNLIDEFTSSFVTKPRVRDALLATSERLDKRFGKIIKSIADSPYIEDGLEELRNRMNNTWLNIFVTLIKNHKTAGGDLIEQLYHLKATISRYNKIEKKKNKRLIGYEIFAVVAAVFSVPIVLWINTAILGSDITLIDTQANIIISRIILYSLVSLIVVRMVRRI